MLALHTRDMHVFLFCFVWLNVAALNVNLPHLGLIWEQINQPHFPSCSKSVVCLCGITWINLCFIVTCQILTLDVKLLVKFLSRSTLNGPVDAFSVFTRVIHEVLFWLAGLSVISAYLTGRQKAEAEINILVSGLSANRCLSSPS